MQTLAREFWHSTRWLVHWVECIPGINQEHSPPIPSLLIIQTVHGVYCTWMPALSLEYSWSILLICLTSIPVARAITYPTSYSSEDSYGRTPGHLSRASRHLAIKARMSFHSTIMFGRHLANSTVASLKASLCRAVASYFMVVWIKSTYTMCVI